ncbi:MAG TPA: Arm DNA-binding domain-containing protein, partial [Brumimicrobium sp.]|nr:Arm DNA-binding domain-containing protein [Brumimicrobium sp.]
MNHKQKLRLSNRLNLQREKEGMYPIYVRIYVDGKKSEIFTDYWIKEIDWDNKKRLVKSRNKNADLINAFLNKIQTSIETDFFNSRAQNIKTSALALKNKYLGIDEKPTQKTILDALDYHNTKMEEKLKIGQVAKKGSVSKVGEGLVPFSIDFIRI